MLVVAVSRHRKISGDVSISPMSRVSKRCDGQYSIPHLDILRAAWRFSHPSSFKDIFSPFPAMFSQHIPSLRRLA